MKKVLSITLCIVLATVLFSGCRRKDNTQTTTTPSTTVPTTTAPTTQEATAHTDPTGMQEPSMPQAEGTDEPSTVSPTGGVENGDTGSRSGRHPMDMR